MKFSEFKQLVKEINKIMDEVGTKKRELLNKQKRIFREAIEEKDDEKIEEIKKKIELM